MLYSGPLGLCNNSLFTLGFSAVLFLEMWKRESVQLAFNWDTMDYNDSEERPRPEYINLAPLSTVNPITGRPEAYFPRTQRYKRLAVSFLFIILMVRRRGYRHYIVCLSLRHASAALAHRGKKNGGPTNG